MDKTEVAKNSFYQGWKGLLDSYQEREAAIEKLEETQKEQQTAIDIKSKAIWEQAELQGKSIIATASAEL